MKHSIFPICLALTLATASCSKDTIVKESGYVKTVNVKVENFEWAEKGTKTAYTVDPEQGFRFTWTAGDVLGFYPVGGDQVAFPISSGEGSNAAVFDGGAWALRSTYSYACYYPFSTANYTISETQIPVSYTGQTQTGNDNTSHLGAYDYLAAPATQPDGNGVISVTMKHLGCFARFKFTMPVADTFTQLTLTSNNAQFKTAGTVDLSQSTPAIASTSTSATYTLTLSGVSTAQQAQVITLYAMFAPTDMSGSTITATITGTSGNTYTAELQGKNMVARKSYAYAATVKAGTINGEDAAWDEDGNEVVQYQYVDLGLSVKWATMNVGATAPEGYGDYFAWGATEPLYEAGFAQENPQNHWKTGKSDGYCWNNAPYQTANTTSYSSTTWTKYLGSTTSSYKDASATDANALKTVLDPVDDAAYANWGGNWRMPTIDEWAELRNSSNCTWTWTTINGINGYKVQSLKTGYTDKWIFLPAAGYRYDTYLYFVGSNGDYWSSSLNTGSPYYARGFYFNSSSHSTISNYRYGGRSVRPVCQ